MTPTRRIATRMTGLFALIAFAATGCAPGAGQGPGTEGPGGDGEGQIGTVTTTTTPTAEPTPVDIATDTPEDEPGPTVTGGGLIFPTLILTIPPGLLLPWPSPADCLDHNPAGLAIKHSGSGASELWQIVDGTRNLLAYKRQVDADAGLALAKSYRKHCFIGRSTPTSDPNRSRFIMDYWLDPVAGAAAIPNQDCVAHDPATLSVETTTFSGATRYRLRDAGTAIALFYTQADADNALKVLKHYNRNCYIGRGYTGADRLEYITNWFANA